MIVRSPQFTLIAEDKKRLLKSLGWSVLAVIATFVAEYLKQYGLPKEAASFAPLLPFIINFLDKWATENKYFIKN